MNKELYMSKTNRRIAGVCGGLAEFLNINATIVRLLVVLFFLMVGWGPLFYIIAMLVMGDRPEN